MCYVYSVLLLLSVCYALIKFACARYYKFDPIHRFRARPDASRASCFVISLLSLLLLLLLLNVFRIRTISPDYDVCDLFCLIFSIDKTVFVKNDKN